MKRLTLLFSFALLAATYVKAEYVVLRNGQRLNVAGYQLTGDKYLLQLNGGVVEVLARDVMDIEPEEVFTTIAPAAAESAKKPFMELIRTAAARYSIDPDLITSVIAAESNFDPRAVSRRNARGLMQLLPQTAARLGVQNIFDPQENIEGGTRYLRDLLQLYKNDLALALAAYNAGPERVQQYGRVPPFAETISYVRRVKRAYNKTKAIPAIGKTPARRAPAASAPVAVVRTSHSSTSESN